MGLLLQVYLCSCSLNIDLVVDVLEIRPVDATLTFWDLILMTQATDITVKKYDLVTDILYYGIQGSSGDGKSPAIYRSSVSGAVAFRPELRVWGRDNGNRTARRVDAMYFYPQLATNTTTGVTSIVNKMAFNLSAVLPMEMPPTDCNEAVGQFFNLLYTARMKDVFRIGYAET